MKKTFFLLLILAACQPKEKPVTSSSGFDGPYVLTKWQYGEQVSTDDDPFTLQALGIVRDGYWIGAFYGKQGQSFDGIGGGTYTLKEGKYTEHVQFYSWDSTAVGKVNIMDVKIEPDRYTKKGIINTDRYKNYIIYEELERIKSPFPLTNNSVEGVWTLQLSELNGKPGFAAPEAGILIYAYPRFVTARYNPETGQFISAMGGLYWFDGDKLVEHIDFNTGDLSTGLDYKIDLALEGDQMKQTSRKGKLIEVWKKAPPIK